MLSKENQKKKVEKLKKSIDKRLKKLRKGSERTQKKITRTIKKLRQETVKSFERQKKERRKSIRHAFYRFGMRIPDQYLTSDEAFVRQVSAYLNRSDIVIDIGAHVGMAAVQLSHHAGRVYAFEPHPIIFKDLEDAAKRYRRIIPMNAAASNVDGTATLFSDDDPRPGKHTEGSTLAEGKSNVSYTQSFEVKTIDLARFVRELDRPVRMIKMDVEGFEYQLINWLLDGDVLDRIDIIHVEDHCDRVAGLSVERDATLARIAAAGLADKFDFDWP